MNASTSTRIQWRMGSETSQLLPEDPSSLSGRQRLYCIKHDDIFRNTHLGAGKCNIRISLLRGSHSSIEPEIYSFIEIALARIPGAM